MSRRTAWLVVIVCALIFISEIAIPFTVSFAIEKALTRSMPSKDLAISARTFPGVLLLTGRFSKIRADAADAKIGKLNVHEVHMVVEDATIDIVTLLKTRQIIVSESRDTQVRMVFTESDLKNYLNSEVKEARNSFVTISKDKVEVKTSADLGGLLSLTIGVKGKIIGDSQSIKFLGETLSIGGAGGLSGGFLSGEIVLVDLTKLPFKVGVRQVIMEEGKVTILADNHL